MAQAPNPDRLRAMQEGRGHYFGGQCPTCGFSRRYVKNRTCVNCETASVYVVRVGDEMQPEIHQYADSAQLRAEEIGGTVMRCTPLAGESR